MKNGIFVFLLLLIAATTFAQVYDQELETEKKQVRDVLMQLIPQVTNRLADSTLSQEAQISLFNPILAYIQKKQPEYLSIRRKYLEEIPAPPAALSGLSFQHLQDSALLAQTLYHPKYAIVALMYCYKPSEISAVVNSMLQPYLYTHSAVSSTEAGIGYTFGQQVFAKKLGENVWQIWFCNRTYVSRFIFDLDQTTIKNLEFTAFNDPRYLKIRLAFQQYTPRFVMDQLYLAVNRIRWNAYSVDRIKNGAAYQWEDTISQSLKDDYVQNREQFYTVRKKLLEGLSGAPPAEAHWQELTADLLPQDMEQLNGALKPYFMHPDEVAYHLFSATHSIPPFKDNINEIGKNAMVGFKSQVIRHDEQTGWEIRAQSCSIAFEYTWNIQTGMISGIKVFQRQD